MTTPQLNVQDPICNYIAGCPAAWQDITIHHLLTHTSGLSSERSSERYQSNDSSTGELGMPPDPAYFLGLEPALPLDTRPGEQFAYNNLGYILLAHIIEQVSGQSYAGFLEKAIFTPLNMHNTGYEDRFTGLCRLCRSRRSVGSITRVVAHLRRRGSAVLRGGGSLPVGSGSLYRPTAASDRAGSDV
jgi:CubicO group peptidase (beta-lactamase class C family)